MAFFKFRKSSQSRQDEPNAPGEAATSVETVDSLRRRALYRLIGAAILVLVAIVGFPMLFDTQPRPVAVQAPIVIPDRNTAPPLALPASADAHSVSAPVLPASSAVSAAASLTPGEQMLATAGDQPASAASAAPAPAPLPPPVVPDTRAAQQAAQQQATQQQVVKDQAAKRAAEKRKADEATKRQRQQAADAARARALLDGQHAAPAPSAAAPAASAHAQGGRYAIQIGAFATSEATQITRQKAERAGIKTYTETVTSSAGARTRVRVGPFASRDEAARMLSKIKQAGLPGSILPL